jgi:hypothetical protein
MSTISHDTHNMVHPEKATPEQLEAARIQHDRDLEDQAKRLEKEVQDARHTQELEEKVKHLQQELEDAKHPPAPLPWPLNHLHGQADGEGGTEVAVVVAHPAGEDAGHVVEAAQVDHSDHAEHSVDAVAEPVHHEVVADHDVVA